MNTRATIVEHTAIAAIFCLLFSLPIYSQEAFTDQRTRLVLDTEFGSQQSLGYKFPSLAFGTSLEVPFGKHLEFQSSAVYSPDRKEITSDGESAKFSASALGFATHRLGFIASLERTGLWTSQFDKTAWLPSAGIVLRNDYFGPGRFFVTYVFPTGCQWATTSNPCQIQSNRLQGVEFRQEVRAASHLRWGFRTGIYHFCDQGTPNDPPAGRNCHFAATAMATLGFEFHLGAKPHFVPLGNARADNF